MSEMKRYAIGNDIEMPALGLGTWKSDPGECYAAVKEAIRVGYRHIDGAWIYGNEDEVGRAVRESIADGVVTRDELFLVSKLWNSFHRPEDVEKGCRETLTAWELDHVDVYLMHWPVAFKPGVRFPESPDGLLPLGEVPVSETFEAMLRLRDQGLVKQVGVSNFSASKLRALGDAIGAPPAVNQVELHPVNAQPDLVAFGQERGIHHTAYSPLGSNDRPESMRKAGQPPLLEHETVVRVAKDEGVTPGQLLIAWAIARGTSVIPKSANPGRIKENFDAAFHSLSADAKAALDGLDQGARFIDPQAMFVRGVNYEGESFWD